VNGQIDSSSALTNLQLASRRLSVSLKRLSSGSRITNPKDDAAGLAQSIKLNNQSTRIGAAIQNNQNLTSLLRTQDGILANATKGVNRLSELSVLAEDITKSNEDKNNYKLEYDSILQSLQDLTEKKFNKINLFSSSSMYSIVDEKGTVRELSGIDLTEALKTTWGLKFDGVDDYAEIPDLNISTDDYTIEIKLGPNSSGTAMGLMRSSSNTNQILIDANYINNSEVWMSEGAVLSTPALTDEHMLSITANGNGSTTSLIAYQNGAQVQASTSSRSVLQNVADNHPWVLGTDWDGNVPSDFFSGTIHEIRVWNHIRTAVEIEQNYNKRLTGFEDGLIGHWDFDSISPLSDKTNGSEDIILNGPIWTDSTSDESAGAKSFKRIVENLSELRAIVGARLTATNNDISLLQQLKENLSSSVSKIMDTNIAEEAEQYAKSQILNQSSIAMLSHAKISSVNVMELIP